MKLLHNLKNLLAVTGIVLPLAMGSVLLDLGSPTRADAGCWQNKEACNGGRCELTQHSKCDRCECGYNAFE